MAVYINYQELRKRNSERWPDLMPTPALVFRSPIQFFKQYSAVWRLNHEEDTKHYREKMDRETDDLRKARMFREAHGLPEQAGMAAKWGLGVIPENEDDKLKRLEEEKNQKLAIGEPEIEGTKKRKVLFGIWEY
jgi:hypothetical protein